MNKQPRTVAVGYNNIVVDDIYYILGVIDWDTALLGLGRCLGMFL